MIPPALPKIVMQTYYYVQSALGAYIIFVIPVTESGKLFIMPHGLRKLFAIVRVLS